LLLFFVGLDDTDSVRGGCTTFIAYNLLKLSKKKGIRIIDFPRLIRLNPNVPWKTRGNAAVGFSLYASSQEYVLREFTKIVTNTERYGSSPSLVILSQEQRKRLAPYFSAAVSRILDVDDSVRLIKSSGAQYYSAKKRGLVGAAAAATELLTKGDFTFEMLAYRKRALVGSIRRIDPSSVLKMERLCSSFTFNNTDGDKILITPHGMDPVLYGIRGENPEKLFESVKLIRGEEPCGGLVYCTNQGTDAHYVKRKISEIRLGDAVAVEGTVVGHPTTKVGGHIFLTVSDGSYSIRAAFYRETGDMRLVASRLIQGDSVTLLGGIKINLEPILNVEKMIVNKTVPLYFWQNPPCKGCGSTLESMGKNQGYRCKKCDKRYATKDKLLFRLQRMVIPGLYVPPLRYFRHLMKPERRYGRERLRRRFLRKEFKMLF
jgi:tRNA(Ile2)-agmatinylcytidine synthase